MSNNKPLCVDCKYGLCALQVIEIEEPEGIPETWKDDGCINKQKMQQWSTLCFWAPSGFILREPYEMMHVDQCTRHTKEA